MSFAFAKLLRDPQSHSLVSALIHAAEVEIPRHAPHACKLFVTTLLIGLRLEYLRVPIRVIRDAIAHRGGRLRKDGFRHALYFNAGGTI